MSSEVASAHHGMPSLDELPELRRYVFELLSQSLAKSGLSIQSREPPSPHPASHVRCTGLDPDGRGPASKRSSPPASRLAIGTSRAWPNACSVNPSCQQIEIEQDSSQAGHWQFKDRSLRVAKAIRIPHMYMDEDGNTVREYLLSGYEGSGGE
jgi:hypothetical protein